jgi:hypothetical protein
MYAHPTINKMLRVMARKKKKKKHFPQPSPGKAGYTWDLIRRNLQAPYLRRKRGVWS